MLICFCCFFFFLAVIYSSIYHIDDIFGLMICSSFEQTVLVGIFQEPRLWTLLARARLAVVTVTVSVHLGNFTLHPCFHPWIYQWTPAGQFTALLHFQVYFTWPMFWGCQHDLSSFLIWAENILGYFSLSYFLSSVFCTHTVSAKVIPSMYFYPL